MVGYVPYNFFSGRREDAWLKLHEGAYKAEKIAVTFPHVMHAYTAENHKSQSLSWLYNLYILYPSV